jgi:hypothetical protein
VVTADIKLFHYSAYGTLFRGSLGRLMDAVVVGVLRLGCLMFLPCCVVSNGIVGGLSDICVGFCRWCGVVPCVRCEQFGYGLLV